MTCDPRGEQDRRQVVIVVIIAVVVVLAIWTPFLGDLDG